MRRRRLHVELLGGRWQHTTTGCSIVHVAVVLLVHMLLVALVLTLLLLTTGACHIYVDFKRLLVPVLLLLLIIVFSHSWSHIRICMIRLRSIRVAT